MEPDPGCVPSVAGLEGRWRRTERETGWPTGCGCGCGCGGGGGGERSGSKKGRGGEGRGDVWGVGGASVQGRVGSCREGVASAGADSVDGSGACPPPSVGARGAAGVEAFEATRIGNCLGEAVGDGEQRGGGGWVRTGVFGATEHTLT